MAILLAAEHAIAQSSVPADGPAPDKQPFVLHSTVQEVLLYCAVLDHSSHLVLNLNRNNFAVKENGHPATILHFDHKDVPISLTLALDDSASMREKRSTVGSAALELVRASNPEDETAVMNFADTSYLDQDFTTDAGRLRSALEQSKTVSGGTAMFDAVIAAAAHLTATAHHSKQVIVVVTDGQDNASANDLLAAIRRVQAANGPVIYSIGLLYDVPGAEARLARHDLQALSDETGGLAFFPASVGEVDRIAAEVAHDIRSQYTVGYRPPADAGGGMYRTIAVTAADPQHGKLTVRTRRGYVRVSNATPEP